MKFALSTTKNSYQEEDGIKELEEIGFTFKPSKLLHHDGCFIIEGSPKIELNSLDELIQFANKFGEIIVEDGSIEIYNDYRE